MSLFVGQIRRSDNISTVNSIIQQYNMNNIYGITFPIYDLYTQKSTSKSPNIIDQTRGIRLAGAKDFKFIPSRPGKFNQDDFYTNLPMYKVRECLTRYNSSTGQQEVYCYEGDSNFTPENRSSGEYNVMIEFPLFYYCRPSRYTFFVSNENLSSLGFLPSPMHYRGGTLYNKVYISKYSINTQYKSIPGTPSYGNANNRSSLARTRLKDQGLVLMDYNAFSSIIILAIIKYGNLNLDILGQGAGNNTDKDFISAGTSDIILGTDGRYSNFITDRGPTKTLGLDNLYGYRALFGDGIFSDYTNDKLYINDIPSRNEETTDTDIALSDFGFDSVDLNMHVDNALTTNTYFKHLTYYPDKPYIILPDPSSIAESGYISKNAKISIKKSNDTYSGVRLLGSDSLNTNSFFSTYLGIYDRKYGRNGIVPFYRSMFMR